MPFTVHILHAIFINLSRLFSYGFRSRGRSLLVSIGLISFEVTIIPLAIFYDIWAPLRFKKDAPRIMEDDFVSMKKTPALKLFDSQIPSSSQFKFIKVKNWRNEIALLLKQDNWSLAYKELDLIRKSLNSEFPGSHFLCKHFLESVHLAVANTCNWSQSLAAENELRFKKHRALFIWWQAIGYEGAQLLDYLAFSLHQNTKMPILINDVPPIPVPRTRE